MGCAAPALAQTKAAALDRSVLPIPEPTTKPITELDARKAKAPARFEVKAPQGAPNVVIVLIDDIGFGHSSAFGGPIRMPTLIHLISIPVTNTSVNPARSTGPALIVGGWALQQLWLFWVAPLIGAALAGVVYRWLGTAKLQK